MTGRIAVIGAGVAGAVCARQLAQNGQTVSVFDKGRSVGGRLAQRRRDGAVFDHGAQFIRAREETFTALLEAGIQAGVVARWSAVESDGRPVYVGVPSMAAPLKLILGELDVHTECRITELELKGKSWWLRASTGHKQGPFSAVALAVPAPQAAELLATLGDQAPERLVAATEAAKMAPCWALLLAFDPPLALDGHDALAVADGPISWIARNTSKPGRAGRDAWTVHASPDWSAAHLEEQPEDVARLLRDAFFEAVGIAPRQPAHIEAHRWRYALVTEPVGEAALLDQASRIGACGDWCLGGKVEAAFLSGRALAEQLLGRMT